MSTKLQKFVVTVSVFLLMVILGCAAFQEILTPCYIPPSAIEYADANAISVLPWTTLFDAKRISAKLDYVHAWNQLTDKVRYKYEKGITQFHVDAGEQVRATLFSPTGPLGLLVTSSLGITVGGLLVSTPKDRKKIKELEAKNNKKKA